MGGAYFGPEPPTQAQAGKGGGRLDLGPAPLQQEIDLREKLRQLGMSENEVLARQRVLAIEKIKADTTLTAAQKETP